MYPITLFLADSIKEKCTDFSSFSLCDFMVFFSMYVGNSVLTLDLFHTLDKELVSLLFVFRLTLVLINDVRLIEL